VECFWTLEENADREHVIFPDGCADLIFSRRQGLHAVGVMRREQRHVLFRGDRLLGVRFHPGAARDYIGVPGPLLLDQRIPLEDLWGSRGSQLMERLGNTDSWRAQFHVLADALPAARPDLRPWLALRSEPVESVADAAGCSPRQLRRRCLDETGLTPKRLARILRFRRALRLARSPDRDWADIAICCGYFDQAHLIRDFREFTGGPPMSVFSNRPVAVLR
jgi:AraC-like DNA-binding protein